MKTNQTFNELKTQLNNKSKEISDIIDLMKMFENEYDDNWEDYRDDEYEEIFGDDGFNWIP